MANNLTHWKKLINPDYLGAYSLNKGEDLTLTIDKVVREQVTGIGGKKEECTIAYFVEPQKPMILNRTNSKMIAKIQGTPYIEEWNKKRVTIYASTTKLGGEMVECLRIREQKPENTPLRVDDTVNFNKCKAALKNGYTMEDLRKKWSISPEIENELLK